MLMVPPGRSRRMKGWLVPVVLMLFGAGCVSPAAPLDPAAVAALDSVTIEGATTQVLANGDRVHTLVTEVAGTETIDFDVPPGTTYVEAVVDSDVAPVGVSMRNTETKKSTCMIQTWTGWNQRANGARCTAIAATDPATKWTLLYFGGIRETSPFDGAPINPVGAALTPVPITVTLTLSAQPLDGSAAHIKLDALSKPTHDLSATFSEDVPASLDGALLNVEITLPEGEGPWPVIMAATPYATPERAALGRAHDTAVQYWVARGYAFVTMDLRGTGTSGGCYAARSAKDPVDIADAVKWVSQQEWSNGKIGMTGFSYTGYTPAAAAAMQAPLTAIYIGGAAVDMWSNYVPGGVETGRTFTGIVAGYGVGHAAITTPDDNPLGPVQYTADAFCDPTILAGNDPRHTYDAWWAERNITELVDKITIPVALEQGFYDNNVKANYVPDFFNALPGEKRGVFGSWQHIWAYRADQNLRVLAWMDHWLKDADTGIMKTPVVEVLTNTREWRSADAWPTPGTNESAIEFGGGSLLAAAGAAQTVRRDALIVETEVLEAPLYLTGVANLDLALTLPAGGAPQFEARLFEVLADGDVIFASVGWQNGAHRPDHKTFAPFAPGESDTVTLAFQPQDHVFQAGSLLRLELRAITDDWGGPEAALAAPTTVDVDKMTLRLPTLPVEVLSPQPRSAS